MDNAMYIMHKLAGEFGQKSHVLQVRLGDRLAEYARRQLMEYNGVRDRLA
jgi:hypothetical protein